VDPDLNRRWSGQAKEVLFMMCVGVVEVLQKMGSEEL
jgi:hypothetical protein